jgi:hypothetical protein
MTRIAGAALLVGTGLSAPPAQAAFAVTLTQEGPNVVAKGSGTINTTDLTLSSIPVGLQPLLNPQFGIIITGPAPFFPEASVYTGILTGPMSFGSGGRTDDSSGNGNGVGISPTPGLGSIFGAQELTVPIGYVSGSSLMDTSTYDNATLASLGVTPGTYVWTWGSGTNADSFTLKIGAASVPEPATLGLVVLGLLGAGFARRKRPN